MSQWEILVYIHSVLDMSTKSYMSCEVLHTGIVPYKVLNVAASMIPEVPCREFSYSLAAHKAQSFVSTWACLE